jgi:hypothetical protein
MRTVFAAAFLLFASFAVAEAQQVAVHPPDGSYTYNWTQGGAVAGQSTIVFKSSAGHVTMRTDTNLPGVQLAGATIVYGSSRLEFQSYSGFATTNGQNTSIDLKLVNGAVAGTTTNGSVTNTVNVSQLASVPAIAVDDGTMGTFLMLPAQINARGANSFQLIPIVSGISGYVQFSTSQAGPYPFGVPTSDVIASFGGSTTLWYNPNTFVVDQFARGPLTATLVNHP